MNNVISVNFSGGTVARTANAYQYDYGQLLAFQGIDLPVAFECHFANAESGDSVTQIGSNNTVTIPDSMFLSGAYIYAWVFLHTGEDDGETEYKAIIPILKRAKPTDDVPTPVEQSAITQAIAALDAAVEQTGLDVIAADAAQAAAELAQGKAEDAQEAAETAQGKAEDAQTAAETAEGHAQDYATAAGNSATAAAQSESNAEAWAVGKRNGVDVPSTDPTYENNSKYYAELAEQSAAQAGYMFFYIDENGHLIYQHTPNVEVDFYLYAGHLYVRS